jgi:hypothetical protein
VLSIPLEETSTSKINEEPSLASSTVSSVSAGVRYMKRKDYSRIPLNKVLKVRADYFYFLRQFNLLATCRKHPVTSFKLPFKIWR